jgi:hypothetical protein
MTYPRIGNEVDNLGLVELEIDYSHQYNWRSVGRTIAEALLFGALILGIFTACAIFQ